MSRAEEFGRDGGSVPTNGEAGRAGEFELVTPLPPEGGLEVWLAHKSSVFGFLRVAVVKRALASHPAFLELRELLLDEARALAYLDHANVVSILDAGESPAGVYLATEYVDGNDLATVNRKLRSRGEALPFELACHIGVEILRGLHHAHHARGPSGRPLDILHRDVSPPVVLVARTGHLKLSGFGRVAMRDRLREETKPGEPVTGQLPYMSPARVEGRPATVADDVYSVAMILFELLTGRPCFSSSSTEQLLDRILGRQLRLERLDREGVPAALRKIVSRGAGEPGSRPFGSAEEMANALETWVIKSGLQVSPWVLSAFFRQHSLFEGRPISEPPARLDGLRRSNPIEATERIQTLQGGGGSIIPPSRSPSTRESLPPEGVALSARVTPPEPRAGAEALTARAEAPLARPPPPPEPKTLPASSALVEGEDPHELVAPPQVTPPPASVLFEETNIAAEAAPLPSAPTGSGGGLLFAEPLEVSSPRPQTRPPSAPPPASASPPTPSVPPAPTPDLLPLHHDLLTPPALPALAPPEVDVDDRPQIQTGSVPPALAPPVPAVPWAPSPPPTSWSAPSSKTPPPRPVLPIAPSAPGAPPPPWSAPTADLRQVPSASSRTVTASGRLRPAVVVPPDLAPPPPPVPEPSLAPPLDFEEGPPELATEPGRVVSSGAERPAPRIESVPRVPLPSSSPGLKRSAPPLDPPRSVDPPKAVEPPPPKPASRPEAEPAPVNGPGFSGDLAQRAARDVLIPLLERKASGQIEFKAGPIWKRLTVREGTVISVASNMGMELLGEQLVRKRMLDRLELDKALRESPNGEDGVIARFLRRGLVPPDVLARELAENIRTRVEDLLTWKAGTFKFTPGSPPKPDVVPDLDLVPFLRNARSVSAPPAITSSPPVDQLPRSDRPSLKRALEAAERMRDSDPAGRKR